MNQAMSDNDILKTYFALQQAHPHNTKRLFAIGFIGLPGTGKSTVAKAFAQQLNLPISSNDQFRRYLNSLGFEGSSPRRELVKEFAEARTEWYYKHQTSLVVDADFSEQRLKSEKLAADNQASLLLIRLECSKEVAINRIRQRMSNDNAEEYSAGDINSYERQVVRHAKYPTPFVYATVDTEQMIEPQVQRIIQQLTADGYI